MVDVDKVLIVDNDLRTIDIPEDLVLGVESDEDVQVLWFDMPRYYNEIDLSEFGIRVNYMNAMNEGDVYAVVGPTVSDDRITFPWIVGRRAAKYKGQTKFILCLKKVNQSYVVTQEFNTTVHYLPVLEGLETSGAIIEDNPDIFEELVRLSEGSAEVAEAFAAGTINGVAVDSTNPAYHNNAKYYASSIKLFVATDTSTSRAEILEHRNAGDVVVLINSSDKRVYTYVGERSGDLIFTNVSSFGAPNVDEPNYYYKLLASDNTWSSGVIALLKKASPFIAGTPTANTAPAGTDTTQLATTEFVNLEIAHKTDSVIKNDSENPVQNKVIKDALDKNTAASARQLIGPVVATDNKPFLFRQIPSGVGSRVKPCIVGASVGWNQLVQNGNFPNTTGWDGASASISASANAMTMTTSGVGACYTNLGDIINGHKYFLTATINTNSTSFTVGVYNGSSSVNSMLRSGNWSSAGRTVRAWVMSNDSDYTSPNLRFRNNIGSASSTTIENVMLIDLTLLFGSAIADKAYEKEQATAGSGIAWLRSYGLLPTGYEAYNAGSIKSVNTSGRKTVGKNLFDYATATYTEGKTLNDSGQEVSTVGWGYVGAEIPVRGGETYTISGTMVNSTYGGRVYQFDENKNLIDRAGGFVSTPKTFTALSNCAYVGFQYGSSLLDKGSVQIELGSTATAYEPYESVTYPTEATDLRGIFKLDGDTIYADGDLYPPSGEGTRNWIEVDMGDLVWTYSNARFSAPLTGCVNVAAWEISSPKAMCALYPYAVANAGGDDKVMGVNAATLYINDSAYTSKDAFVAAVTGKKLIYKLATPTTLSLTPYTEIQQALTTEEWLGSEVPVGQSSEYYEDMLAKLVALPKPAENDGKYRISQSDGQMELEADPLEAEVARLQALIDAAYVTDSVSGDIASFPDGADDVPVKSLVANIEPIQDLHGYDNPWPAGGGVNKVDQTTLTNTGVVSDTGATGTQTTRLFSALFPVTPSTTYYAGVDGKSSNNETIQFNRFIWFDSSKTFISRSSTGQSTTGVNITTPANAYYASIDLRTPALTTNLVAANVTKLWFAVGSGTVAYSPYSNICPISGWAGANVYRTGVNVFDGQMESGAYDQSTGVPTSSTSAVRTVNPITAKPSTTYRYVSMVNARMFYYTTEDAYISNEVVNYGDTFTTPSNASIIRFQANNAIDLSATSINYPSTDHNYHAYNGTVYPIDWTDEAGTVYGGTLNVTTGVLTVTHKGIDMGSPSWTSLQYSGATYFYTVLSDMLSGANVADALCSVYPRSTVVPQDNSFSTGWSNIGGRSVVVRDDSYTLAQFQSAMAGQTLVYELTTPITYQLTPTQVATLLGVNNIWADCGDVSVEYRADTKKYIAKVIA